MTQHIIYKSCQQTQVCQLDYTTLPSLQATLMTIVSPPPASVQAASLIEQDCQWLVCVRDLSEEAESNSVKFHFNIHVLHPLI